MLFLSLYLFVGLVCAFVERPRLRKYLAAEMVTPAPHLMYYLLLGVATIAWPAVAFSWVMEYR